MKITDLSLEDKILQTEIIRIKKGEFNPEKAGAAFFFGEIIEDAEDTSFEKAKSFLQEFKDNADIPLLICGDFESGCGMVLKGRTCLPMLMGLGATDSEKMAYDFGKITALEARTIGADWTFCPVVDLARYNKQTHQLFGDDIRLIGDRPERAIPLLRQIVRGMQENGLGACLKHFPGPSSDGYDAHCVASAHAATKREWWKMQGRVYKELIADSGVYSVMVGHESLPAFEKEKTQYGSFRLPATLSHELVTDLLKGELDFRGVVVTDAFGMGATRGWFPSERRTHIESFRAGNDMILWPSEHYVEDMKEAVENGYVSMERLDDAVSRILDMKEKMGMFHRDDHPLILNDEQREYIKQAAREMTEHSITLLRDDAGHFPMSPEKTRKIAIVGVAQFDVGFKVGDKLADAFREKGFDVTYYRDDDYITTEAEFDQYDLVIYALFSRPHRPQGFVKFQGRQPDKIKMSMCCGGRKTVAVSFGSPMFMDHYFTRVPTCVNAYSIIEPSARAFVRAACGEIPFGTYSPIDVPTKIQ